MVALAMHGGRSFVRTVVMPRGANGNRGAPPPCARGPRREGRPFVAALRATTRSPLQGTTPPYGAAPPSGGAAPYTVAAFAQALASSVPYSDQ